MRVRSLLIALIVAAATLLLSVPASQAQQANGTTVRSLITALNNGDASTAQAALAPAFRLTLADGTSATGSEALQDLLALPTPVTVVSLTSQGPHMLAGMLQFGGGAAVAVTFGGTQGHIATMALLAPVSATSGGAAPVAYPAGWNLIAGPDGTVVTGTTGPLYTYQAGDTAYETVEGGGPLRGGIGYWAFFAAPASISLASGSSASLTLSLPAGQWVLIGDPFTSAASVSGAGVVESYSPSAGYQPTATLQPGQGAWALSATGAVLTFRTP